MTYDVLIIGGGPAGLSAALALGRARRAVLLVDGGPRRNAAATHVHNFLTRDGTPPAELRAAARAQLAAYPTVELRDAEVHAITGAIGGFRATLTDGADVAARRVLLATGMIDQPLPLPGFRELWGHAIVQCPYCHGWEVRDQPVGVLGNNPGAILHAQLVRQWSDDVIYFAHTHDPSSNEQCELDARGITVVRGEVARVIVEHDHLTGVELVGGAIVPRAAVFIRPINTPHPDGLLASLGCDLDAAGFAIVDHTGKTSTNGVWAAGNVVDPRAQVITSAGAGSAAAIAINADLVLEDIADAVVAHRS